MATKGLVILTREHDDNQELATSLLEAGFEVVEYECLKSRIYQFSETKLPPNRRLTDYQILAFTSKRAVPSMIHLATDVAGAPIQLAAVGEITAQTCLQTFNRPVDFLAHPQTGEGLARVIISKSNPCRILHLRGNKVSPTFRELLQTRGYEVEEVIVYETYSPPLEPLKIQVRGVVVFGSPSAVDNFFKVNGPYRARWVAIGPVTAARVRIYSESEVFTAETPSLLAIMAQIELAHERGTG